MLSFLEGPREHRFSPRDICHLYNTYSPELSAFLLRRHGTRSLNYIPASKPSHGTILRLDGYSLHWQLNNTGHFLPHCRRTANRTDVKPFFCKFSAGTYHLLPAAELITGTRKEQEQPNTGRKTGSQWVLPTLSVCFAFWAWAHGCDFLLQPYNTVIFSASKIVPVSYNRIKLINISWYCNNKKKPFW